MIEEKKRTDVRTWYSNPSVPMEKNDHDHDQFDAEKMDTVIAAEVVIPEVIETEEEQRHSRIIGNRLIVCLLALALLWMTSLQNAISIINVFIRTPRLNTVISVCQRSYNSISEEKKFFGECVDSQLAHCNRGLNAKYFTENEKKKKFEISNAALLLSLHHRYLSVLAVSNYAQENFLLFRRRDHFLSSSLSIAHVFDSATEDLTAPLHWIVQKGL